jgi:hypothetical protein
MDVKGDILPEGIPGEPFARPAVAGLAQGREAMIPVSELMDIVANLKQTFVTQDEARAIAREELPSAFKNLDSFPNTGATKDAGIVLKLGVGAPGIPATAYWGREGGAAVVIDWSFGIKSISGADVTFHGGPVVKGTGAALILAEQVCTITATGQTVYVVYTFASDAASFGIANAANFPRSGSGTFVKALQSFTLTDGVAVPLWTHHRGVVQVDGCYS